MFNRSKVVKVYFSYCLNCASKRKNAVADGIQRQILEKLQEFA